MKFNKLLLLLFLLLFLNKNISAQWEKTGGPPGITINCYLDMDSILFCGTTEDGVYKSEDHGLTWHPSNVGMEHFNVYRLNTDGTYIYAISGYGRIFRSSDFGQTWQLVYIHNKDITPIASGDGSVFVGSDFGLISSVDSGVTWNSVVSGLFDSLWINQLCYTNHRLIVSQNGTLYSSSDTGQTFSLDTNFVNANFNGFFSHGDTVFAFSASRMYKSVDGGISWTQFPNPIFHGTNGMAEINDTLYAGSSKSVFMSPDWGQTWTETVSTGIKRPPNTVTCFGYSGSNLLLGYEYVGSFSSLDKGQSYLQCNLYDFHLGASVISLCSGVRGIYAGTYDNGIYFSDNAGATWAKLGSTDPLDTLANAIVRTVLSPDVNIILAGTHYFGIYRSVDNGNSWNRITNGLPIDTNGFFHVSSLAQSGDTIVASTQSGIFYSTDLGVSWSASNINGWVQYISASDNVLCGSTNSGEIYRSSDHGATWNLVYTAPYCWELTSNHNGYFYAATDSVLVSYDYGVTWNTSNFYLNNRMAMYAMNDYAWIADNFSNDSCSTFTTENSGINYPFYYFKCFTNDNNFLYASLQNSSVWRRPLSDYILNNIAGKVYYDRNLNNIFDSTDFQFSNIGITLNSGANVAVTNINGDYYFKELNGLYTVTVNLPPGFHITTDSLSYTINVVDSHYVNLNFGIAPDSLISVNVECGILSSLPRCNTIVPYSLTATNTGIDPASGVIELGADAQMVFISSVPPPTSVVGNNYFWNYTNLSPFSTQTLVIANFMLPSGGNTIYSEVHVSAIDSLGSVIHSSLDSISQNVLCAFDPNEKLVSPAGTTPIPIDTWLNYTIYFQNTGNDTAFLVRILDTLDASLDVSKLEITGSSSPVAGGVVNYSFVNFIFDNILLADSNVNEPASHGFVSYRIKAKTTTPDFTEIKNTAYIYFDFNSPIQTNTTSTLLSDSTVFISEKFTNDFNVILYPNPFSSFLQIKIVRNNISDFYKLSIMSIDGKVIRNYGKLSSDNMQIGKEEIEPGIYILQFENIRNGIKHFSKVVNIQ